MSKSTILFIPGSFALPEFYDELFDEIRVKGLEIRGLHMPTVGLTASEGRPGRPPTMYDDAAFIAKETQKLADEGKDVILIGHSYGGVPVTEGSKGLGKKERQVKGEKGGIVGIAYMTCLVPSAGESVVDLLAQVPESGKTPMQVGVRFWAYFLCSDFISNQGSKGRRLDVSNPARENRSDHYADDSARRSHGLGEAIPQALLRQLHGQIDAPGIQGHPRVVLVL